MSSRRTLILLGAIAIGIIAAFALFNYVSGIEDRERGDAELVPVLKADQTIARGISGGEAFDSGDISEGKIPREYRPEGFVSTVDEIAGLVALFEIPAGSVLVKNMFVDPSQTVVSFRERLRDDGSRVAVSFTVTQVQGVADLLVPGDEISMFTIQAETDAGGPADVKMNRARLVYSDVHILAIGQTPIQAPGESSSDDSSDDSSSSDQEVQHGLITVDVPISAAQIIMSLPPANWYLTLNPANFNPEPLPAPPEFLATLPGEDPALVTPYGPDGSTDE